MGGASRGRAGGRVAVVGAGVVGTCTAWYLRRHGFEVEVLERRDGVALETSWGNAGVIAPGYVTPWAAPGMPRKVLSYLFAAEAPVLFRPVASAALARWIGRWLRECGLARYRVNKARMQRLAFHSRDALHALRAELGIDDVAHPLSQFLFGHTHVKSFPSACNVASLKAIQPSSAHLTRAGKEATPANAMPSPSTSSFGSTLPRPSINLTNSSTTGQT